ncbi:MAG TPA: CoA transferase [Bacillota bacterium]|nr:CoA transferase [Bacillota bacterium]
MKKMLEGVKVIDLSRNLAAPFCTMILADLGAEVIKVEAPETGDDARGYGPIIKGKSGYFISINRGKKSVTLNLKSESDKDKLAKLIREADVMVDNFRPGVLDRLGITQEWLDSINPKLIFTSITGFGHTGPYRTKAAYDLVVQGYGGLMSVTGEPGSKPTRVGVSIGDLAAGLYAAIGIIGSLYARTKSGQGDRLDIAMLDCQIALLENTLIRYIASGKVPEQVGNRHASITPFEMFPSKDGYIIICIGNEKNWRVLCNEINHPELIDQERFINNDNRTTNHEELYQVLCGILKDKSTAEWIRILDGAGIPCGPVNNVADIMENEQVKERKMIVSVNYPDIGEVKAPGCPIKSKNYLVDPTKPAPELGQDNEDILGQSPHSF